MKKVMGLKNIFFASVLFSAFAVALAACSSNELPIDDVDDAISFSTKITTEVSSTRAYDDIWELNDGVGIFMTSADYNTSLGTDNAKHNLAKPGSAWNLVADGNTNKLYYPTSATNVRFIAYYPYKAGAALSSSYTVTLGNQATTKLFDLLYYKDTGTSGVFKKGDKPALTFDHMLSKIVVNIKKSDEVSGADITAMTVTLTGTPSTASFNLQTGALSGQATASNITTVVLGTPTENYARTHQAILIPNKGEGDAPVFAARTIVFTYKDQYGYDAGFTYEIPVTKVFSSLKAHTYNFTVVGNDIKFEGATVNNWDTTEEAVEGEIS